MSTMPHIFYYLRKERFKYTLNWARTKQKIRTKQESLVLQAPVLTLTSLDKVTFSYYTDVITS